MDRNGLRHAVPRPASRAAVAGGLAEPVVVQGVARERADDVRPSCSAVQTCVQRIASATRAARRRARGSPAPRSRCPRRSRRGRPRSGSPPPAVARRTRTAAPCPGSRSRTPAARSRARRRAPARESAGRRAARLTRRHPVEAADPHVDRMDRAAADQVISSLPAFFSRSPRLHHRRDGRPPSRSARRSRGSPARAAGRCAARGSRSTHRSRAAGASAGSPRAR